MPNPIILYDQFICDLTNKLIIKPNYQNFNLCISGGGMAAMYSAGIIDFLQNLHHSKKININNIYCTSAGAIAGLFFIW